LSYWQGVRLPHPLPNFVRIGFAMTCQGGLAMSFSHEQGFVHVLQLWILAKLLQE